ncbi:hypothetical protein JTB14_007487 [Gonioctena quinquepunctata]|nr:hypothetical protein JTB14_007487 [Gonioctena quinquepunctata]
MHTGAAIHLVTNKPDTIMDYNCFKGGFDTVDIVWLVLLRMTRRCFFEIFFQLVTIARINSQIVYKAIYIEQKTFSKRIGDVFERASLRNLPSERATLRNLPSDIQCFLTKDEPPQEEHEAEPPAKIRGRCFC